MHEWADPRLSLKTFATEAFGVPNSRRRNPCCVFIAENCLILFCMPALSLFRKQEASPLSTISTWLFSYPLSTFYGNVKGPFFPRLYPSPRRDREIPPPCLYSQTWKFSEKQTFGRINGRTRSWFEAGR